MRLCQTCWMGRRRLRDLSWYQHKASAQWALSYKTPQPLVLYLEVKMPKEKKKVRTEKLPCSLCLCWQCCQRWECSSYPNQLELTSSHKAVHKTTFAQNGYNSARPVHPYNSHHNPTASPEAHTVPCLPGDTGRAVPPLLAGTLLRKVVMSSNTTHCSNTLDKNILKGIWASVKSCKPSNVVDNGDNPWHLPGKEWQRCHSATLLSGWLVKQIFFLVLLGFGYFYDDALLCLTLRV